MFLIYFSNRKVTQRRRKVHKENLAQLCVNLSVFAVKFCHLLKLYLIFKVMLLKRSEIFEVLCLLGNYCNCNCSKQQQN